MKLSVLSCAALLLWAAPLPASPALLERYCGSDTPLDTPYFLPFQKTVEAANGCASPITAAQKTEVHVLRVSRPAPEVSLHVGTVAERVALVLATPHPVTWRLSLTGAAAGPPHLLVSDGSTVVDNVTGAALHTTRAILANPAITGKLAIAQFNHINSFTSIDTANKISISLPQGLK